MPYTVVYYPISHTSSLSIEYFIKLLTINN